MRAEAVRTDAARADAAREREAARADAARAEAAWRRQTDAHALSDTGAAAREAARRRKERARESLEEREEAEAHRREYEMRVSFEARVARLRKEMSEQVHAAGQASELMELAWREAEEGRRHEEERVRALEESRRSMTEQEHRHYVGEDMRAQLLAASRRERDQLATHYDRWSERWPHVPSPSPLTPLTPLTPLSPLAAVAGPLHPSASPNYSWHQSWPHLPPPMYPAMQYPPVYSPVPQPPPAAPPSPAVNEVAKLRLQLLIDEADAASDRYTAIRASVGQALASRGWSDVRADGLPPPAARYARTSQASVQPSKLEAASMAKSSVSRSMAAEDMDAAGARSSITRKLDLDVASIQAERQRAINRTADIGRRTVAYSNQH